jgi:hypothetical protein
MELRSLRTGQLPERSGKTRGAPRRRNEFSSRLSPPGWLHRPGDRREPDVQPLKRLSDNAKKTIHALEAGRTRRRAPNGPTMMPHSCIRTLAARQPALPAWPHSPSLPSPAAR